MRDVLKVTFVIAMFVLLAAMVPLSSQMYSGGGPQPFIEAAE